MPYDALQTLLRAAVLNATTTGAAVFFGAYRGGHVDVRVGGNVTGTNPTLDIVIQESADGVSSWVTIATVPQIIDEMVGYVDDTTTATDAPMYEVPGEDPVVKDFNTTKDYIRAVATIGGTATPTFRVVSIEAVADARSFVRSGR